MEHDQTPSSRQPSSPLAEPVRTRSRRWLGTLLALISVAVVIAVSWFLVERSRTQENAQPAGRSGPRGGSGAPAITVGEAIARQESLPVYIDALGTVVSAATVTVRPQVSGQLSEVLFTEGQMVRKGQLLARIDAQPFQAALQQARGSRQRDEAQLENARLTLERFKTLQGQDSIARQEVDTQAALVRQLEGTLVTDRAAERSAELELGYARITSPISGRVGLRTVDAGNYVSAGDATGVAVVTQIAPIDVQFSVPQDRVPDIRERAGGAKPLPVTALDRTRATTLATGTFSTLDNLVDVQTGTIRAKARFDNADGSLFPNQFVNVRLLLQTIDNAVVVPVTALRTGAKGDYVYVINDDRTVSQRPVERGRSTVTSVALGKGLQAGERVVTEGGDRIKDGAKVRLASDPSTAGASGANRPRGNRGKNPTEPAAQAASRPRRGTP